MDTGGNISPAFRCVLNLGTAVYALLLGIPSMVVTAVLCALLPCCSIGLFRLTNERPFIVFMTLSSIVASLLLMLVVFALAAPVVVPVFIVATLLRCCGLIGKGTAAEGGGAAAAAAAAAGAGAGGAGGGDHSNSAEHVALTVGEPLGSPPQLTEAPQQAAERVVA